jgi:integrase
MQLGACDAISLAAARSLALGIRNDAAHGKDPAVDRREAAIASRTKEAHDALTLNALIDKWAALRLKDRRQSYADEAPRAIRKAFAKFLSLPAADLKRTTIVAAMDDLTLKGAPVMATRAGEYLRTVYAWAVKRGMLAENPATALPTTPAKTRDRVLADSEIAAIWKATEGAGPYNAIVRMLLLTGQRREEVAAMAWSELSPDLSTWTIPGARTKNHATHIVPLSVQASAIVGPKRNDTDLVFPNTIGGVWQGFSWPKDALDKASGVKDWRLHDLRRTTATGLQKLGVRLEVTESVLNHERESRRNRRRLPAPRLGGGEEGRAPGVGRSRPGDRGRAHARWREQCRGVTRLRKADCGRSRRPYRPKTRRRLRSQEPNRALAQRPVGVATVGNRNSANTGHSSTTWRTRQNDPKATFRFEAMNGWNAPDCGRSAERGSCARTGWEHRVPLPDLAMDILAEAAKFKTGEGRSPPDRARRRRPGSSPSCWPHRSLDPPVDHDSQLREIDRLREQAGRAALHRLAAGLRVAIGGDHDNRTSGRACRALSKRSRLLIPGMFTSERIRIRLAWASATISSACTAKSIMNRAARKSRRKCWRNRASTSGSSSTTRMSGFNECLPVSNERPDRRAAIG